MPCPRLNEDVRRHNVQINDDARPVHIANRPEQGSLVVDRGKHDAAIADVIIPIARNIDASAGCPAVMRRDPHPIGALHDPIAGPPKIAAVLPNPASRRPDPIGAGHRRAGTQFKGFGRRRQIGHLHHIDFTPKTGNPLHSGSCRCPVAGNPFTAGRDHTPHAADPNEIAAVFVPSPVAGDPRHIRTFRTNFRRNLFDRAVGRARHNDTGGGAGHGHLREGLMHRTAR